MAPLLFWVIHKVGGISKVLEQAPSDKWMIEVNETIEQKQLHIRFLCKEIGRMNNPALSLTDCLTKNQYERQSMQIELEIIKELFSMIFVVQNGFSSINSAPFFE